MARTSTDRGSRKKTPMITLPGMKDVEGKSTVPEGEHQFSVEEVTQEEGQEHDYLKWKLKCDAGTVYYNTSLAPQALWNLKGLLEAMGIDPPDDETEMEVDDFLGKEFMGNVEFEVYNGKNQSKLVDFWPLPADDEKKPASKKSASKDEDDGDEDDGKSDRNSRRRERRAERRSSKEDKKSSKKGPPKLSADEVNGMDEEELAGVVEEYELDCDLEEAPTLRKKKAAVIKALGEADQLED